MSEKLKAGESVAAVADRGLCTSCGLCVEACALGAIAYVNRGGSMVPRISGACVSCGACLRICPGSGGALDSLEGGLMERMTGPSILASSARAKDAAVLAGATSGGIATQLASRLLESGRCGSAFLVGRASTRGGCWAERFARGDDLSITQGSKYLQASHGETLRYMRRNPRERVAITAVPCAVRGLLAAIDAFGLDRENYLFIGLFCDKTMTSNVMGYFQTLVNGPKVASLDFKSKKTGSWPGHMRLYLEDGGHVDFDRSRRMRVKGFFQPECCLYCLDKLNVHCDIALGDDYTGRGAACGGASSVIVRTERGMRVWNDVVPSLEVEEVDIGEIGESQHLKQRTENYTFGLLKQEISGKAAGRPLNDVPVAVDPADLVSAAKAYLRCMEDIELGRRFRDKPDDLLGELARRYSLSRRAMGRAARAFSKLRGHITNR